jgi:hypothetical protein
MIDRRPWNYLVFAIAMKPDLHGDAQSSTPVLSSKYLPEREARKGGVAANRALNAMRLPALLASKRSKLLVREARSIRPTGGRIPTRNSPSRTAMSSGQRG